MAVIIPCNLQNVLAIYTAEPDWDWMKEEARGLQLVAKMGWREVETKELVRLC